MIILLSLAFYIIVGCSVAEKGQESKQIALHTGESPSYFTPDKVDALDLFCWIDTKILSSDIPDGQIVGYCQIKAVTVVRGIWLSLRWFWASAPRMQQCSDLTS